MGSFVTRRLALFGAVVGWMAAISALIVLLGFDHSLRNAGRADLGPIAHNADLIFAVGIVSASTVGAGLAARKPHHPVGWLFVALGFTIALSGDSMDTLRLRWWHARDRCQPGRLWRCGVRQLGSQCCFYWP